MKDPHRRQEPQQGSDHSLLKRHNTQRLVEMVFRDIEEIRTLRRLATALAPRSCQPNAYARREIFRDTQRGRSHRDLRLSLGDFLLGYLSISSVRYADFVSGIGGKQAVPKKEASIAGRTQSWAGPRPTGVQRCASNIAAAPVSRITTRSLCCCRSPLALNFAEPVRITSPSIAKP